MGPVRERRRDPPGAFVRGPYVFADRVSADGSTRYPAAPGRYHLYVSAACPWAQRSMITRELKGLQNAIGMTVVDPVRDSRGWAFRDGLGHSADPVNGFAFLREAYLASDPGFSLSPTVPVLWDRERGRIVSNRFDEIELMLATEFEAWATRDVDTYPTAMRPRIDELNEWIYPFVNNGVYRCGFAKTQEAYDAAFVELFGALDRLERLLGETRFLAGDAPTQADVRLFTTLARFDAVYYLHFKCNKRRIVDSPNLWAYARDLWTIGAFSSTTNMDHIKRHYYLTHPGINPTGIVPAGPDLDWEAPHGRERLSG